MPVSFARELMLRCCISSTHSTSSTPTTSLLKTATKPSLASNTLLVWCITRPEVRPVVMFSCFVFGFSPSSLAALLFVMGYDSIFEEDSGKVKVRRDVRSSLIQNVVDLNR